MRLASPSATDPPATPCRGPAGPSSCSERSANARMIPQLVRAAVLVDQPHDLALVLHEVGGELQRDHRVHLQTVGLGDVEGPPHRHLVRELPRRVPLAGDRHELGLVAGRLQRAHERLGVGLGAAAREGRLRMEDRDPHREPGSSRSRSRATSASSCCTRSASAVVSSASSASSRS